MKYIQTPAIHHPLPSEKWFVQAGRYATKGEKQLRATVCLFDRAAVQGQVKPVWNKVKAQVHLLVYM